MSERPVTIHCRSCGCEELTAIKPGAPFDTQSRAWRVITGDAALLASGGCIVEGCCHQAPRSHRPAFEVTIQPARHGRQP